MNDKDLKKPFNIFVGRHGRIITCDLANKQIKVISPDGNDLLQSLITPIVTIVIHYRAWCNSLLLNLHLIVSTEVFCNAGVYQCDIGSKGSGDGPLTFLTGIAIDIINHIGHPCDYPLFGYLDGSSSV